MTAATDRPDAARAAALGDLSPGAWWRAASRAAGTAGRENLALIAAGCAFYGLLALAPAFAALATLYGLFADPADIAGHLEALDEVAPPAAYGVIENQAGALRSAGRETLGWASLGAILLAIWSARAGVRALMTGVAIAYREPEGRGMLKDMLATYLLTALFIVIAALTAGAIVVVPALIAVLPIGETASLVAEVARWPIGLAAMLIGLGALYRYGPARRNAQLRWVAPGAAVALALWLAGSVALTLYLARFGEFNETYGALGAVAALLMWFWLSALATLTGAALNAELELETARDTTVGPPRPMGDRGAAVADAVAEV